METRLPETPCPTCGHRLDAATGAVDDTIKPTPGAVTLCIDCGEILVFTEDLGLRLPTKEENLEFSTDRVVMSAQLFIRGRKR